MSMVHPMARTTPRTRAEIHESQASLDEVAQTYNISRSTAQELIVMEVRRLCLLPLDDLVSATRWMFMRTYREH